METFGDRVKARRKALGLNQTELGKLCGLSQSTVQNIESKRNRSSGSLVQLADALGVRPEWLATGQGPMTADKNIQLRYEQAPQPIQNAIQKLLRYPQHAEDAARAAKVVEALVPDDDPQ